MEDNDNNILICGDQHIHNHGKSHQRLEDGLSTFRWIFETAKENKINKIVCTGDLFHSREKISIYAYFKVYAILKENKDIHCYFLLGNHDLWFYENTDISSVMPFDALPNVTVIKDNSTIEINGEKVDFIPFTHDPISAVNKFENPGKFLFSHIAIDDAILNKNHKTTSDVSIESDGDMVKVSKNLFSKWKMAFFGHYHYAQKIADNAEYIGSSMQLDFGEANQDKHIIILNLKTLEKKYVINNFSPKFYIVDFAEAKKCESKDGFFKIEINDESEVVELRESLIGVRKVEFTKKIKEKPEEMSIQYDFDMATGDVIDRFIKSKKQEIEDNKMDFDFLAKIGRQIHSGEKI